jgi:ferritin-like metal-binding protein YciE
VEEAIFVWQKEDRMSVETMEELLIDELKDLYSAEKQIIRSLPKLAKAASTPELQQALLNHLEETKGTGGATR